MARPALRGQKACFIVLLFVFIIVILEVVIVVVDVVIVVARRWL
jgi:hypothetical protein